MNLFTILLSIIGLTFDSFLFGIIIMIYVAPKLGLLRIPTFVGSTITYFFVGLIFEGVLLYQGSFSTLSFPYNAIPYCPSIIFPIFLLVVASISSNDSKEKQFGESNLSEKSLSDNAGDPNQRQPEIKRETQNHRLPHTIMEDTLKKVEVASEHVSCSKGSAIIVKRSRSLRHDIRINSNVSAELSGNARLIQIINMEVRSTIGRSKETGYQESETVEYSVKLDGNISRGYTLIWTHIWRQGKVQVELNGKQRDVPFEYLDGLELNVIPDTN